MGLGKTAQLCIHFGSLARQEAVTSGSGAGSAHRQQSHSGKSGDDHLKLVPKAQAKPIFLVVCPATVLQHWLKEFHKWSPEMRVVILHSVSTTGNELRKMKDEFQMKYVIRTVQRLRSTRQGHFFAYVCLLSTSYNYKGFLCFSRVVNVMVCRRGDLDDLRGSAPASRAAVRHRVDRSVSRRRTQDTQS